MNARSTGLHTTANLLAHRPTMTAPVATKAGRYEYSACSTATGSVCFRRDDLSGAQADLEAFKRTHAGDRSAMAGIYDMQAWTSVNSWWGGERVGPVDTMHPMERMMRRAVRAGQAVFVGPRNGRLV